MFFFVGYCFGVLAGTCTKKKEGQIDYRSIRVLSLSIDEWWRRASAAAYPTAAAYPAAAAAAAAFSAAAAVTSWCIARRVVAGAEESQERQSERERLWVRILIAVIRPTLRLAWNWKRFWEAGSWMLERKAAVSLQSRVSLPRSRSLSL